MENPNAEEIYDKYVAAGYGSKRKVEERISEIYFKEQGLDFDTDLGSWEAVAEDIANRFNVIA